MQRKIPGNLMKDYIKKIVANIEGAEAGSSSAPLTLLDTGNYALNNIISGRYQGGFPLGRVVDVFGDPSTGKSLLIYHLLANVQKMGGVAILDDTEDAYLAEFGSRIGINNDELIRLNSLTVEEHFEKVFLGWKDSKGKERLPLVVEVLKAEESCPIVVALDSLALLSTRHELEVKFERPDMIKAKQIRAGLRMASSVMKDTKVLHIISNHVTSKIGVLYGPKTTTPGGSGVPFQAAVRVELSRGSKIKDENNNVIGVQTEAHVTKNKICSPFKRCVVDISFSTGIVRTSGLLQNLLENQVLVEDDKQGFARYKDVSFRKSKFQEFLESHPEVMDEPEKQPAP